MNNNNHYQILGVSEKASQKEIKQAYRTLAKKFHPDSQSETADHQKIVQVNAAYEVLGDRERRRSYDNQLFSGGEDFSPARQQRTKEAQNRYQQSRQSQKQQETHQEQWLKDVYTPIYRLTYLILEPLDEQIEELSADPFDDELMLEFQDYLDTCRDYYKKAQAIFRSQPNPAKLAAKAANIYHCLNHISDGIEELERFTLNYDDCYLHTGKELFRLAFTLRKEAQSIR